GVGVGRRRDALLQLEELEASGLLGLAGLGGLFGLTGLTKHGESSFGRGLKDAHSNGRARPCNTGPVMGGGWSAGMGGAYPGGGCEGKPPAWRRVEAERVGVVDAGAMRASSLTIRKRPRWWAWAGCSVMRGSLNMGNPPSGDEWGWCEHKTWLGSGSQAQSGV